ncbi:MAG TPA: aminotransferase class V-fold PLP-dependent enzyme [Vicinamibacterales bacterium]|nr:aminotransferase class V-fold PLP-dependent enzyme [Vicinamibacterales bacterium]
MTFGRAMLDHWLLDPETAYLNHGTVGATPRRVLERQQTLRDEMERQPSRFMLRELHPSHPAPWRTISRRREAIEPIAAFLGANPRDLVFVANVTTGINAVLGSLPLAAGDEIVITDLAYGAVALAARHYCERSGATLRIAHVEYPVRDRGDVVEPIVRALGPQTRLVIIDHVTARTALVLPVAEIAAPCHARGVPVLVDGAHAPGSRPVDIPALGVDWYSANLHKWAHAPRGCGILWAAPDRQSMLRSPIISWGYGKGFLEEFEHTATSDPTSCLAAPEGIALLQEWNFEACVAYMHGLAWDAAHQLADRWGTSFDIPRAMTGSMCTVAMPEGAGSSDDDAERIRLALLVEDKIEVPVHASHDRLWARVSAQVYNDASDITRLAEAVARRVPVRASA